MIYHPSSERLWEDVSENEVVQAVLNKKSGSQEIVNTKGKEFLASYSYVENTGWGIVSQTAKDKINAPITELYKRIVTLSIPYLIIVLIVAGLLVNAITKPITRLANYSEEMSKSNLKNNIKVPENHTFIYEVSQLYYQVSEHINLLNQQVSRDGLTNLANRRALEDLLNKWWEEEAPFSLILIDIDRFKRVNDTYGHLVGDEVLKFLAKEMMTTFKDKGYPFRYGGEEFIVLLHQKTEQETYEIAEDFRKKIASKVSPTGEPIQISLGISSINREDKGTEAVINRADIALYHCKETGRNKTTIYSEAIDKPDKSIK